MFSYYRVPIFSRQDHMLNTESEKLGMSKICWKSWAKNTLQKQCSTLWLGRLDEWGGASCGPDPLCGVSLQAWSGLACQSIHEWDQACWFGFYIEANCMCSLTSHAAQPYVLDPATCWPHATISLCRRDLECRATSSSFLGSPQVWKFVSRGAAVNAATTPLQPDLVGYKEPKHTTHEQKRSRHTTYYLPTRI